MNAYGKSLIRGAIGGLFIAGVTFFARANMVGSMDAFLEAGGVFSLYMATRFGEGTYDGAVRGK